MEGTTALTVPPAAQTASAPVTHTPSAVPAHIVQVAPAVPNASHASAAPAHIVQAALTEQTPVPASPAACVTTQKTAPSAPATTPTVADPVHDVIADTPVDLDAPTPAPIDSDAEEKLTAEIVEIWGQQKDGKTFMRRTRAEMKALRLELGSKLHAMKAILVGTGRGGNWARYLRSQRIPVASADRRVAEHEATLAPPEEKLLTEELSEVDQVRREAKKLLPRLSRLLTSQELAYEFVLELLWNMDGIEVTDTDEGLEIPRTSHEDSDEDEDEDQTAESALPAPVVG